MGQTLSEPITSKETSSCANAEYRVGASCMQGWRVHMEDAHTCFLHLPGDRIAAYFAVFDGHGGTKVAQYAGNNLHKKLIAQPEYANGSYAEAIRKSFLALDADMLNDREVRDELAGSTGIVCLVRNQRIYCANAGDSRAVASVAGVVEQLSFDHKPSLATEKERIVAAGGWVDWNRVNGNLALSRALGDFVFKKNERKSAEEQIVTANPDVIEKELTTDHEFLVIACDGIWDVLTNQEVVNFVRARLATGMEPEMICEDLMMRCLAPDCQNSGLGCDNMTVVIVCFLQGQSMEALQERCSRPSKAGPASDIMSM
jgi:protein phosphatase PTC2/3